MQHPVRKLQVFVVLFLTSTILTKPCFFFCNSFAYASPTATTYLLVSPLVYVSNALGETFKIDVTVFNIENLHAFEFKLSYNTTLLDVVQVIQGPFFPPSPKSSIDKLEIDETKGSVWLSMSLSNSTPSKNGDGTLASIILNVTFAPVSPTKTCCVLDLHDTILYDNTMTAVVHYYTDGLYFWKSMLNDPDEGPLLDLTTQKGGTGLGETSPPFKLGEMVELIARLTSDNDPVQSKLVGFQVLDPNNETVLIRSSLTDNNGVATIEFRIDLSLENIGTWKMIAVSEVANITVWDSLYFTVIVPVGGHAVPIDKPLNKPELQIPYIGPTILLAVAVMTVAYVKKRKRHTKINS